MKSFLIAVAHVWNDNSREDAPTEFISVNASTRAAAIARVKSHVTFWGAATISSIIFAEELTPATIGAISAGHDAAIEFSLATASRWFDNMPANWDVNSPPPALQAFNEASEAMAMLSKISDAIQHSWN